jgi:hypothetical protein
MTDDLKAVLDLKTLSPQALDQFISTYGKSVQKLVQQNNGSEELFQKVLTGLIGELYFRLRNGISFENYAIDILVNTLSIMILKKAMNKKPKERRPLIITQDYYEREKLHLESIGFYKNEDECKQVIKDIGEPGRTILRLSFFDREEDAAIAKHVHFESEELLKMRRLKVLDRCTEIILK